MQPEFVHSQLGQHGGEDWVFSNEGVSSGKSILTGQVTTTLIESTASQMQSLVGSQVPAVEQEALRNSLKKLSGQKVPPVTPKAATVRRRASLPNMSAEPGPSGMRNNLILSVQRARHGTAALQRWATMRNSGRVCQYTTEL